MTGFDLAAGRLARDAGMAAVLARSTGTVEDYKAAYRAQFVARLAGGQVFCSDEITAVVGSPPAGCHPNVIGALFNACLREFRGQVEPAGMTQMRRPGAHARRTLLYRLAP